VFPLKILIVEDDPLLGRALQQGLEEAGWVCVCATDGMRGLEEAISGSPDAIVLDLMLPGLSGLELLKRLREQGVQTPVLVLSALGAVDERVTGLQAGADDYLVKPFAFPELMARLNVITRRSQQQTSSTLSAGPLTLDLTSRTAQREGRTIELTPTEFRLLEYLLRNAGQVVTRRMLCEHLWEADWEGVTNVIEVHINRLRSKIDREFDTPLLQTVRGRGYTIRAGD
jgi:two-component system OmpR family response regulator/two-component system copper resistance phosphate regulon response regulator CusR